MTDDLTRISRYLDGGCDAACIGEIDRWLDGSPENALRFAQMAMLDSELRDVVRVRRTTSSASDTRFPAGRSSLEEAVGGYSNQHASIGRIAVAVGAIAAMLLTVAAAVIVYVFVISGPTAPSDPSTVDPVATLIDATDSVFVNDSFANPGSDYERGTYTLESGSAEFLLSSRVTMMLAGRAQVRLQDPMHAAVDHGSASFDVPHDAVGFTVDLPGGVRVVDLGTRFSASVDPTGVRRVTVIEGRVRIESAGSGHEPHSDTVNAGTTWRAGVDDRVSIASSITPIRPESITASETETVLEEDFSASNLHEPDLIDPLVPDEALADVTVTADRTWVTPSTASRTREASITIDLGRDYEVAGLLLWNYNHAPAEAWANGVDRFVVTVASEAEGIESLRLDTVDESQIRHARIATSDASESAQRFDFPAVRARYVHLHMLSNHGGDRFGLSELRVLGRSIDSAKETETLENRREPSHTTLLHGSAPDPPAGQ